MRVVSHIDINAPAADVFAYGSDQMDAPQWQQGFDEVRRITDGSIGIGNDTRMYAGWVIGLV